MKKLPPRTLQEWQCSFCSRVYLTWLGCAKHERKCYKNPERDCLTCHNSGFETDVSLNSNLEVVKRQSSVVCGACKKAKEAGGKSYIGIKKPIIPDHE